MDVLDFPFFLLCCLSMSNAESRQISFTLYSSEAVLYNSASARAEFKLPLFQNWTENFYVCFALRPNVSDSSCRMSPCSRLHSKQRGRYDRFHTLPVKSTLPWFLIILNFHINHA